MGGYDVRRDPPMEPKAGSAKVRPRREFLARLPPLLYSQLFLSCRNDETSERCSTGSVDDICPVSAFLRKRLHLCFSVEDDMHILCFPANVDEKRCGVWFGSRTDEVIAQGSRLMTFTCQQVVAHFEVFHGNQVF